MLNKEELKSEIKIIENAYNEEINKNGGVEGTAKSVILKSKWQILKHLESKYFNKE